MLVPDHEKWYAYAASHTPMSVSEMRASITDAKEREIFDNVTEELGKGDPVWYERNQAPTN